MNSLTTYGPNEKVFHFGKMKYEYTYRIINELDLKNINITQTMFEELSNTLNTNEDYIKKYIIIVVV